MDTTDCSTFPANVVGDKWSLVSQTGARERVRVR